MYTTIKGGYNARHNPDFVMIRPEGIRSYIILIVKSKSRFQIGTDCFQVEANSAVIISPNISYSYSALHGEYKNDWLYFDTDDPGFMEKYQSLLHRPIALTDVFAYTQYIRSIVWEHNYGSQKYRHQNISMLIQLILNNLTYELENDIFIPEYNSYASGLKELRICMQSQPGKNFTPHELARKLNVSPSYFQFLYKNFFGIPFKTDLINMRLDHAKDLLLYTTLPIEQIALESGYNNDIHFYRQFKTKTDMTPTQYRMAMGPQQMISFNMIAKNKAGGE